MNPETIVAVLLVTPGIAVLAYSGFSFSTPLIAVKPRSA